MSDIKVGDHVVTPEGYRGVVEGIYAKVDHPEGMWGGPLTDLQKYDPADDFIKGWSREEEIRGHARMTGRTLTETINELVNTGLSHR